MTGKRFIADIVLKMSENLGLKDTVELTRTNTMSAKEREIIITLKIKEIRDNLQNIFNLMVNPLTNEKEKEKAKADFIEAVKTAIAENYVLYLFNQSNLQYYSMDDHYTYQNEIIDTIIKLQHDTPDETNTNALMQVLTKIDMTNLKFESVNWEGYDFSGKNLCGTWIRFSNLRDVNLQDADLTNANLYDTDLKGANLTGCKFVDLEKLQFINLSSGFDGHKNPAVVMLRDLYFLCASQKDKKTIKAIRNAIISDIENQFNKSENKEKLVTTIKSICLHPLFSRSTHEMLEKEHRQLLDSPKAHVSSFLFHESETGSQKKLMKIINDYKQKKEAGLNLKTPHSK